MIRNDTIKANEVIFLYSQPPEKAILGVVSKVDYPSVEIIRIQREAETDKEVKNRSSYDTISLSENIPLSVLSEEKMKEALTPLEIKRIQKVKNRETDIFGE